ncbi:MAG TPA: hypothetical protein VHE61_19245, partial [Opitutaceae bacterium]|nr:hypothetical protein [Opitutaceae bacterium]
RHWHPGLACGRIWGLKTLVLMRLRSALLMFASCVSMTAANPPAANADAGPAATATRRDVPTGKWSISAATHAADGSTTVSARLAADAPTASGFGNVVPQLVVRFKSGRVSAYILFDTYLGEGETAAKLTFGAGEPEIQRWPISDDGRAAFVAGDALAFVDRLKRVKTFSIEVTPRHAKPVTVRFTPTGIEAVMKALFAGAVNATG